MVVRRSAIACDSPSRREALSGGGDGAARSLLLSSSACLTMPRSTPMSTGLLTKSKAPAFSASTARSMLPNAVIIATGVRGWSRAISVTSSMPLPSGRRMSVRHRSKLLLASSSRASARLAAVLMRSPILPRVRTRSSRMSRSSSTTSALCVTFMLKTIAESGTGRHLPVSAAALNQAAKAPCGAGMTMRKQAPRVGTGMYSSRAWLARHSSCAMYRPSPVPCSEVV